MNEELAQVIDRLLAELERAIDDTLSRIGFSRPPESLLYTRMINRIKQEIDITLEERPADNRAAVAAVYPFLTIVMPEVNALLREMVGDMPEVGNLEITLRQPIEWNAGIHNKHARWLIVQSSDVGPIVEELETFIQQWTVPFLDRYSSQQALACAPMQGDDRAIHGQQEVLRVIAAKLLCGRLLEAQETMEKWFGRPGPRKRFRRAFEYIETCLRKSRGESDL